MYLWPSRDGGFQLCSSILRKDRTDVGLESGLFSLEVILKCFLAFHLVIMKMAKVNVH